MTEGGIKAYRQRRTGRKETAMELIKLRDGHEIPQIGLGVFRTPEGEVTKEAVKSALQAGYKHIDTAKIYGNEKSTGEGIKASGVDRKDIFLTTKLWNDDIRAGKTREVFAESPRLLDTDYVDLYLIHWPVEKREQAWLEMVKLQEEGKIRSIGVSNFQQHHLEELARVSDVVPVVDQIESNPYFQNQELIDYCQSRGICVEVWSPLGGSVDNRILTDDTLTDIARKYGKSVAQIIIRWHMQRGVVVLPKSTHEDRIRQNVDVFDFVLTKEEMDRIRALDKNERTGADPDHFDF